MPPLVDPRRAAVDGLTLAGVMMRAREAAIEALLEMRVAVREPDAVVLCAAGFDEEGLAAADARARGCGGVR
jgi:hypothetical protein